MKTMEQFFPSWDGTQLFYRAWLPERETNRALILFHRGHEHSGRWQKTVEALGLHNFAIFAWDARGHGKSPGERGSAKNIMAIEKDTDAFVRWVASNYKIPIENMVVIAHSVGAVTAAAWVHDFAPPIRALILATPALRVKLYVPFAIPLLRLKEKLFGPGYVKSYVKAKMLTHDPEEARKYNQDPLIFRQIAVNVLLDLYDTSTRLLADAGAITTPTLVLGAGSDWVVKLSSQKEFFNKLSSPRKAFATFPSFFHAVFHEKENEALIEDMRNFIFNSFEDTKIEEDGLKEDTREHIDLIHADEKGYTKEEYDRLLKPGSICFSFTRAMMKTVGRLSKGIRLGWRTGFDSGVTLDYVYENKPQGTTFLGRMIDSSYLNSVGWRGIRQRRVHLQALLKETIQKLHSENKPIHIVDVAAGAGRYVLETLHDLPQIPTSALLRDYKEENLKAAKLLAEKLGLKNIQIAWGDAFDRDSLKQLQPRPTIGIVSGLFELIPKNDMILQTLHGLADAIESGGYLIYTNQPWHPQVEFIARVLTNREGKPWIMRRRTQAEMDQLVRSAGFEKVKMEIDYWGIFTVSIAKRVS